MVDSSLILGVSAPKQRLLITPNSCKIEMAPSEKNSALPVAKAHGSSKTRSAPFNKAIFALRNLLRRAGVPRWTKLPLMTTTIKSAFVS